MNFKRYLKNYLAQFLSISTKLLSLLIITPLLSRESDYFAIYTYGISLLAFLNYADLGFFRASQKFASEYSGLRNNKSVLRSIGFGTFITLTFVFIISFVFIVFSFYPTIAINTIKNVNQITFAKYFFLLIAIFSPLVVFQRMILSYYEINILNYRFYNISIIANILTLIFAYILFLCNQFSAISYFLLMQIISLITLVIMLFDLKKVFGFSIREIFLSIRFDFEEFSKTKKIAISSFIGMIGWLIFYEIDIVILARFFPLNQLSFYSISLIILSLFRTFTGILFGSFSNRINNLFGNNDLLGYYNFSKIFLYISSPIVLYVTFSYLVLSDFFILHWVGINYIFSSSISQFLVLGYSLSFISYITSSLLLSQNRIKESLYISLFQPFIYWGSVYLLYTYFGLLTVAFMKFIVLFISDVIYIRYLVELIKITYKELLYKIFLPFIIVSLFLYPVLILFVKIFPYSNSRFILLYLAIYVSIILIISVYLHLKIAKVNLKFLSKAFINGNHL